MLKIEPPSHRPYSPHPILNLSFRIFFSAGAIFAALTICLWGFVYTGKTDINAILINPFYWHAHEMIYGYAVAIIVGFLLTAVKTWTGIMMPYGYKLLSIFMGWAIARLGWMLIGVGMGNTILWLLLSAIADLSFLLYTTFIIIKAVTVVKQYKHLGIVAKLMLLTLGNGLCYYGVLIGDMSYMRIGVYFGLYLVIAVVLTIGRRVVPFFIERGISLNRDEDIKLKNSTVLDRLSLSVFLVFIVFDMFYPNKYLITMSALGVAVVNFIRLLGWYHHDIWKKPLLWSLYIALAGLSCSFILFAAQPWFKFSHSLAVHALAISGIGMMTVSMMARVSLGHTGRNIHMPPKTVSVMFVLMSLALIFRVIMPIVSREYYSIWLMIAQSAWIGCYVLFCISYLPILSSARQDKLFG